MKRKRFKVSFEIEVDVPDEVYVIDGDWTSADPVTKEAVADHVRELTWVGGCYSPAHAFFSDRNIVVENVKVWGQRIRK